MRRIVLALALLSGCSFVFVSGPPPHHEQLPYFSCSESRVAPVLDTIFAVLQGANFLFAASISDERWADNYDGDPPIARSTAIPLYAIGALLGVGGAYYGFSRTAACRDAKELALTRAQRNNYGQPQAWPPQQPYPPQGSYPPPQGPYAPPQGPYAPPAQGPYAPPAQGPPGSPPPPPPQAPGAQPPPPPATTPPPPPATPPPPS